MSYIIDGIRTPIGKLGGSLSNIRADDLVAMPIHTLVERNKSWLDTSLIEDVILGCANQAGEDNRNIARMASLLAGLPITVPGQTINRLCASGLASIISAHHAIKSGEGNLFIAGGVEHMTRSPWVMSKSASPFGRDNQLFDTTFGWRFVNPKMKQMYGTDAMGETAENLATAYKIDRKAQDIFALNSQLKAAKASESGRLKREIIEVPLTDKKGNITLFEKDEFIKPDTTIEALEKLKPAFNSEGSVTAGNSSGLNDGAAALLIGDDQMVEKSGKNPLAKIISSAVYGLEPRIMGLGPVEASKKALQRAGLDLKDIDHIEINEAFAAQVIACLRAMGLSDDDSRVNPNGGAIALGHPLGMSGARIALSAAHELFATKKKYALVTMCIGVGQGCAVVLGKV